MSHLLMSNNFALTVDIHLDCFSKESLDPDVGTILKNCLRNGRLPPHDERVVQNLTNFTSGP